MHIAIFVDFHDSTVGGVQTSVRGQRKGLERLGHTVTVVCPAPADKGMPRRESDILVPTVLLFRPNGFPLVPPSRWAKRFIEKELDKKSPIDIIHIQTNMGIGMMGVAIARNRNIPVVQTMHGRDDVFASTYSLPTLTTLGIKWVHKKHVPHKAEVPRRSESRASHNAWKVMVNQAEAADHVIMPSHHFKVKFRDHGVTKPIDVVSNGIDDDAVATLPHVLKKKELSPRPLKVIWCGRLSPEKRPLESIKAVSRLPGAELDLYGNGPLTKTVREYIDTHGLGGRVRLKGRVSQNEVMRAMQYYDVLLYPSHGFDNQPMVILEAVAAGIPIVYCDPDLSECMPGGGGFLTKDVSVESIVETLKELQAQPDKRHDMHKIMHEQRDKIVQSYHSKKMVDIYRKLIKKQAL